MAMDSTTYLVTATWGEKTFEQEVRLPEIGMPVETEIDIAESVGLRMIASFHGPFVGEPDEVTTHTV